MPEVEQATSTYDPAEWEAKYKELQSDYTRKSQALADYERKLNERQLIDKAEYDNWLVQWASENPEAALEVFPALKQHLLQSGRGTNGSEVQSGNGSSGAYDEAIFNPESEAHQKFVQEHGQKAYRQAVWSKSVPEFLEASGLGKELTDLREFKKTFETRLEELSGEVEQSKRYALSSFDQMQLAQDPRRKQIRETIEKLRADPNYWYEVVDRLNKPAEAKPAAPAPAAPAAPHPQSEAPTPEQLANRIDQSSVVPQGAGSGSSPMPSQARDLDAAFDAALAKADPVLAQRLGIGAG